jgi:hypothetical protein
MGLYSSKGFPATRKLAESLNTSAFLGTYLVGLPASGLLDSSERPT